jgi:type II secretion system protein H
MVVVVIVGLIAAGMVLSLGSAGRDGQLEQERDRLSALIEYVRERASVQTIEYGLRCEQGGYRFVQYDTRRRLWMEDPLDDALRARRLPPGLVLTLRVEDRAIELPAPAAGATSARPPAPTRIAAATPAAIKAAATPTTDTTPNLPPQVMLFSSGEMSRFQLTLARPEAGRSVTLRGDEGGKLEVGPLLEPGVSAPAPTTAPTAAP